MTTPVKNKPTTGVTSSSTDNSLPLSTPTKPSVLSSLNATSFVPLVARLTSHPVMISDLDGATVWVNEAFTKLSGWSLNEILGRKPREFLHGPATDLETVAQIQQKTSEGKSFHCEIENYHRDGSLFWISLDAQPILDEHGNTCGYLSVQSDISERKRVEQKWAREHKLLTAIANSLETFVSSESPKATFDEILAALLEITESSYGFLGEVRWNEHGDPWLKTYSMTNIAWDSATRELYEQQSAKGFEFRNLKSLFGHAMVTGEPVIVNSPPTDSRRGGLPEGHPPLDRFLGLPIHRNSKLIGLIGLGNRPNGYTDDDIQFLSPLLTSIGHVIDAYQRDLKRRETEQSLRETEEWLEETSRIAEIGSWQIDVETMHLRWSEQTRRMHDVSADYKPDVKKAIQFYAPEVRAVITDAVAEAIRSGKPWDLELPINTAKGRRRWVRAIGHAAHTDGKVSQVLGVVQDVTERYDAEKERSRLQSQFLHSQKMESVGRLAGGIAHDFNNMLAVILGHAEMSLLDGTITPKQRAHMKAVQVAGQRAASLTRQLLTFASRQHASPQTINLNSLIKGLLELLRKSVGEAIRIEWLPGDDLWNIQIDPVQVDQMLACLCINAREAISDSGRVLLSTRNERIVPARQLSSLSIAPGDYVVITLSDNGRGMDAVTMEHLFEPFNTTKPVGQGPGLGLATVYGIVQQNRGAIEVDSDPEVGTTFRIYFPREDVAEVESTQNVDTPVFTPMTVLLVEDEPSLLRIGELSLKQLGHRVFTARSVSQALHLVQSRGAAINLVISDVVMPEMNGWELVRRIHELQPKIRFALMSGYRTDSATPAWNEEHPLPILNKPFDLQRLAAAIQQAVEEPKPKREESVE